MICIEILETEERRVLEEGFFVRRQRNGRIVRCHKVKRQGICDGETIWSLGALDGCPEAKVITLAEYLQWKPGAEDPELTDAQLIDIIMNGVVEE